MASVIVLSFWKMYSETNIHIEGPVVYENQSSCGQKSHAFDSEKVGRYICIHPLKELEQSAFLFHHKRQQSYLATGSNSIPWYISGKRPLQIK